MHKYLRAIGFSELKTRKDFEQLTEYIIQNAESKTYVEKDSSYVLTEYRKSFGDNRMPAPCRIRLWHPLLRILLEAPGSA